MIYIYIYIYMSSNIDASLEVFCWARMSVMDEPQLV